MDLRHADYCSRCKIKKIDTDRAFVLFSKTKSGRVLYYMCSLCNSERAKKYRGTETGRLNVNRAVKKSTLKYYDRQQARQVLNRALNKGLIVRCPCKECGKKDTEAHHQDYSKPLAVVWLCTKHHSVLHK